MIPSYLLSLDQGPSSSRAIIFKRNGEILGSHQLEHTQMYPSAGQVEHDPEEIWKNCVTCMSTVMEKCGLLSSDISAIGITNQRETTIVWDKTTGKPYHNAIVWNDTRTVHITISTLLLLCYCNILVSNHRSTYARDYLFQTRAGFKQRLDFQWTATSLYRS
jgi:glycerol kinase